MHQTLQIKSGKEEYRTSFVPLEGEFIYTTDTAQVFVGDGRTPGGLEIGAPVSSLVELPPKPITYPLGLFGSVLALLGIGVKYATDSSATGSLIRRRSLMCLSK
ncbi:MAG: hypothetical protein ACR2QC_02475 [Gammaproteobacteria bacterium]